jgi:formylglycine-generating enzyme required for sulfatase activity
VSRHGDWIDVPAGELVRGTTLAQARTVIAAHAGLERAWILKECPQTTVRVPGFAIARTPVTVREWAIFAADTGIRFTPKAPADHPVDGLPFALVEWFCGWSENRTGLPTRLPTEMEWERAARGDDAREYPWGQRFDPERANLREAGIGASTPVGSFPSGASPFGVLDLAGNVDEWTSSAYRPYAGAPAGVPATERGAVDPHVTRGGSWRHGRDLARCARRHAVYPPEDGAGFRLVFTP